MLPMLRVAGSHVDGYSTAMNRTVFREITMKHAGMLVAVFLAAGSAVAVAQMNQPGVDAAAKAAKQPVIAYTPSRHIYPEISAAKGEVAAALKRAKLEHKRVILDFGGDWCGDCQVLDIYFHQSPNKEIVDKHFIEVKVNIGQEDANLDIAHKYGVPITGVPALAVLRADGSVLVHQDKEFSDMRYMKSQSLTDFLNKWKQ
jgi:thiol:disulfide interchange protein